MVNDSRFGKPKVASTLMDLEIGDQPDAEEDDAEKTEIFEFLATTEIAPIIDIRSMSRERRQSPRFSVNLPVVIYSKTSFIRRTCANISLGGLKLSSPLPAEFALENLEIVVMENDHSAHGVRFSFHGRAVGSDQGLAGLRFSAISDRSNDEFHKFIADLAEGKNRAIG